MENVIYKLHLRQVGFEDDNSKYTKDSEFITSRDLFQFLVEYTLWCSKHNLVAVSPEFIEHHFIGDDYVLYFRREYL